MSKSDEQKPEQKYETYEGRVEVVGIKYRKEDALSFAESRNQWLEFEREEDNPHGKNAIRVLGCSKGFFGKKRRFIGYVPKDIARNIVENGFWGMVFPVLSRVYVSKNDYVEIIFRLRGPFGQKYEYKPPRTKPGGEIYEYVDRVNQLKQEGRYDEAIELLLTLVKQTETDSKNGKGGVAPWPYEQLAIIYSKVKQFENEVQILERYDSQPKAPGALPKKLAERLSKARERLAKQRGG